MQDYTYPGFWGPDVDTAAELEPYVIGPEENSDFEKALADLLERSLALGSLRTW